MGAMLAQHSKGTSAEFGFPVVTSFSLVLPFSIIIIFTVFFLSFLREAIKNILPQGLH